MQFQSDKSSHILGCVSLAIVAACAVFGHAYTRAAEAQVNSIQFPAAGSVKPPPPTRIRSTWGRIGLFQVFDHFPPNTKMTLSQIREHARRYDVAWGSDFPNAWRSASPSTLVATYLIQEQDWGLISGHNYAWWAKNHPDWILYACDGKNNPTHQWAFMSGQRDVPLDIHNPAVVDYQIRQLLAPYAIANNYNALAIDQVFFFNDMGWDLGPGYYGCGTWKNGTFIRRYTGRYDPQWAADTVLWMKNARSILKNDPVIRPHNLALIMNHPPGNVSSRNEQQLLASVDATLDESGFSDYGNYKNPGSADLFKFTVDYMRYVQRHGVAILVIDVFAQDTGTVNPLQLEYSIATYLMGNEQGAAVFATPRNGPGYGYGSEQYHPEYQTKVGAPCGEYYGGPGYDSRNPHIYYRKFNDALVIVNSGSLPRVSEFARLPMGHKYTDIEGRAVGNPLSVGSNDGYVLLTTKGCT